MPLHANILSVVRFSGGEFSPISLAGLLATQGAPMLAPDYARFDSEAGGLFQGWRRTPIFDLVSPSDPQALMPPTSGIADNGLPIYSWDQAAAQITRESNGWAGLGTATTVTYGFRQTAGTMPTGTSGFVQFNAAQIAAAEEALALWSEVAGVTFVRAGGTDYTNEASILFGNYSSGLDGASAFAYYPGSRAATAQAGDVWVNISLASNSELTNGQFGAHTLAHEIGHAIGLAHPANYDATDAADPTYPGSAVYWQDGRMFTVMSYFGSLALGGSLNAFAAGPQLHDIAAAQRLYGANMTTRTGDTIYGFNSNTGHAHFTITAGQSPVFAIWDAGGIDTLDLSGFSTPSEIDLRPEAFSSAGLGNGGTGVAIGNIAIARGVIIENGIGGSGADTLIGNSAANTLIGNDGADTMDGGDGADNLQGGAGDDTLRGGAGHDHLYGGAGIDTLDGGDGYDYARYDNAPARVVADTVLGGAGGEGAGDTFVSIEGLVGSAFNDFLSGGDAANDIHGMGGADVIQGRGGNDYLGGEDGADHLYGGAGIDTLDGGAGFDYARYDDAPARVVADTVLGGAAGEGAGDTFISIEGLVGSAFNDFLSGSDIQNDIHGMGGSDVIQGRGGNDYLGGEDGADHLFGGAGADTLDGGAGFDYVRYDDSPSAVTVNLATGGTGSDAQGDVFISIEGVLGSAFNDTLTGTNEINDMYGGAGADTMFGLGGGDALTGDAGADRLNGGAGADILTGGDDADTFVFVAGQANGDTVTDFSLSGGDVLEFSGYGTAAQGATFVQLDATHWQITSSNGLIVETLTIANGVVLTSSDYVFGP